MNYFRGNKQPVVKLRTVNVIEITNGDFQGVRSFAENSEGNKRAERLFKRCIEENKGDLPMDKEDFSDAIEEGTFEHGGYQLFLTHSV